MCRPPGRPKSIFDDFGIDFGLILASRFHQNFDIFRNLPKPRFYWKNNEKSMIFHLRGLPFPPRFLIKFSRSFQTPSKTNFFRPLIAQGHQKGAVLNFLGRFWRPARFRGVPKISQNRTRLAKWRQTGLTFCFLHSSLEGPRRSKSTSATICHRFGIDV